MTPRRAAKVKLHASAVTGHIRPVSCRIESGRTESPLHLAPYGSAFIMFGKIAPGRSKQFPMPPVRTLLTLRGPWHIGREPGLAAPASMVLPHLTAWTTSRIPGVKYFSGTATYTHTFDRDGNEQAEESVLDLGNLQEPARMSVAGKRVRALGTPPLRVDITRYVRPGINTLSIAVTNPSVNRLIVDQQPGVEHKYTFTITPTYESNAPLRTSGRLGPVRLQEARAN